MNEAKAINQLVYKVVKILKSKKRDKKKDLKGRHELKHNITKAECYILRNQLHAVMQIDPHAGKDSYLVRSVYFDNIENKAFNQKLFGIDNREKFRVRMYNTNLDSLHLEKKSKKGNLCFKEACPISVDEYERIQSGDISFLKEDTRKLMRELFLQMRLYQLRPNNIVQYQREPFIYPHGNVRITLDSHLQTSISNSNIQNPDTIMVDANDPSIVVLEVKYDEFLPDFIKGLIQLGNRRNAAISKYLMSRIYG